MKVEKVNSAQSFGALNIKKVAHEHRGFIRADLGKFKELGERYDITMKSHIDKENYINGIVITVRNLKEKYNFLSRFFRPESKIFFDTVKHYTADTKDITLLGQTQAAIDNLRRKSLLRVVGGK